MKAKKITKMTATQVARMKIEHKTKWLTCTTCTNEVQVDEDVIAVKCSMCTTKSAPVETRLLTTKKQAENPAGWRFMAEYVDKDGNVFFFGEEQPELKGTKESSDVDAIRKDQKKKREDNKKKRELREKLKEERMAKQYDKKMKAKKKAEDKKQEKIDTIKGIKKTPEKKTKAAASVRYEKFEEPKIATDRQQIENMIATEGTFSEHLSRRAINSNAIVKVARTSYAAISNETGEVTNKRRGYKVTLETGDVKIININVK